MQTLLDIKYRKKVIDEILGAENQRRKLISIRRFEIYNKKQAPHVLRAIQAEFPKSHTTMRKVTSINIAPRIIDDTACVYKEDPERKFFDADGNELEGPAAEQAKNLYDLSKVNDRANRANRIKRFQNQCILMAVPRRDRFEIRALHPHQLDCIPMEDDPTEAFAYIINEYMPQCLGGDGINQTIADYDDAKIDQNRSKMRFIMWSAEHNIRVNGNGELLDEEIDNPIGELPFYDISDEKEGCFWVDKGSNTIDFAIDFAVMLSDTANTNRMQAYAQGVYYGKNQPTNFALGPNNILYVPTDENAQVQDRFEFVTPNPDLNASMDLLDRSLNIHLTSEKVDPKILNSKGEARTFASGFERLLAMYEKYDATKDDLKAFCDVEAWIFHILSKWSNAYQGRTSNPLNDKLLLATIPDGSTVVPNFAKPEMVQTKAENEDSVLKLYEAGVMSIVEAVMDIYGVTENVAIEKVEKLMEYKKRFNTVEPIVQLPGPAQELKAQTTKDQKAA